MDDNIARFFDNYCGIHNEKNSADTAKITVCELF